VVGLEDCPLECDSSIYRTNIFSSSYPTKYYSDILIKQETIKKKFSPAYTFAPDTLDRLVSKCQF